MSLTLREWRRLKEISQEEMAEKLKVHVNTFQRWERESGKIPYDKACEIAAILEVPIDNISFVQEQS